jgi:glycosyltransferase involved in cell wall biosynthesis
MQLSLIIPCYNEADNLERLLQACAPHFHKDDAEVILVNNGSTDHSATILAELLPHHPYARSVEVPINQGYGFGILAGLKVARGKYIGWTHADLQTDPKDALQALTVIKYQGDRAVFIKGKRYGRQVTDLVFTWGMSLFASVVMGVWLWDINAQPNLFPRSFFETWQQPPHDFSLDLYAYVMAKRQKLPVLRFPVHFGQRLAGEAHLNSLRAKLRYTLRTIRYSLSLRQRWRQT